MNHRLAFNLKYLLSAFLLMWTLIASPLALAKKKCNPIADFLQVVSEPDEPVHYSQLGQFPGTQKQFRKLFNIVEADYLETVDFKEIKKALKIIAEDGYENLPQKTTTIEKLKDYRIHAQRLRSAYTIFAKKRPKEFQAFVRDFGYLNDAIIKSDKKWAKDMAKEVLKHMKNGFHLTSETPALKFKPADPGAMLNKSVETLNWVYRNMDKQMDIHMYHDIKKAIRDYKTIYSFLNEKNPSPVYERLGKIASKITNKMGKEKDKLFAAAEDVNNAPPTAINEKTRELIRTFISEFSNANEVVIDGRPKPPKIPK